MRDTAKHSNLFSNFTTYYKMVKKKIESKYHGRTWANYPKVLYMFEIYSILPQGPPKTIWGWGSYRVGLGKHKRSGTARYNSISHLWHAWQRPLSMFELAKWSGGTTHQGIYLQPNRPKTSEEIIKTKEKQTRTMQCTCPNKKVGDFPDLWSKMLKRVV